MKDKTEKTSDQAVAEPGNAVSVPQKKVKKGFFARLRRESKRDRQLAALSDGYQQLVGLMSSIQMNMDVQAKNQQQLLGALENLPEVAVGLQKMGNAAERQIEVIELMRDQLNSNIERDKILSRNVSRINKTLVFTNLLFVLGIAAAVYFFMSGSAEKFLPVIGREIPTEQVENTPDSEQPSLIAAMPTNQLVACSTEACSNKVTECKTGICTSTAKACTNTVEACTNSTEVCTNAVEAYTNEVTASTDPVVSD